MANKNLCAVLRYSNISLKLLASIAVAGLLISLLTSCGHESSPDVANSGTSITVIGPTANDDDFTVARNSGVVEFDVLDNDASSINNSTLTIVPNSVTAPSRGGTATSVSTANGDRIAYEPANGVSGAPDETFSYTISNADGETATAQVSVSIIINDPPVAEDDAFTINKNSPANRFDLLANDSDPDMVANNSTLTIVSVTAISNGAEVDVSPDSLTVVYEPDINFVGTETFEYIISDGASTAMGTVTVTVNDFNPATQMQFRPCEAEQDAREMAGRPFCFDVLIPSFDGHTIGATVFVPADLGASRPPVILHAHGFGESRFGSLENPNAFMRFRVTAQALLDLWHEGYWVVTFDQRGFRASGLWGPTAQSTADNCIQAGDPGCIDVMNPEREGRDATVVMDWIVNNLRDGFEVDPMNGNDTMFTPPPSNAAAAFAEDEAGDPILGSIGLSYGGGWQTIGSSVDKVVKSQAPVAPNRTADTRIDAMVPVTTWHDIGYSLVPNDVPKSGWFTFLAVATNTGGTAPPANGFLGAFASEVVLDNVQTATLQGLRARSVRSYCEGEGDDTLLSDGDADLDPELGSGTVPGADDNGDADNGPDVFVIQGQRDTLFNLNEAYDMAQCYQQNNPASDVRMLIQTEGHILPAVQGASYQDMNTPASEAPQIIYIDETVFCDGNELQTRVLIADWFRGKLGVVADSPAPNLAAIPTVCINQFETNAAPITGTTFDALDDMPQGDPSANGDFTFELDSDANATGAQPVTFTLPGAVPTTPPTPVHQQTLITATSTMTLAGIPLSDLDITAAGLPGGPDVTQSLLDAGVPQALIDTTIANAPVALPAVGLDEPRFFVGFGVIRNGQTIVDLIADQIAPISGPRPPTPATQAELQACFDNNGCEVQYTYPRVDEHGVNHGEDPGTGPNAGKGRLVGFGVTLNVGDQLVLVIYDNIALYAAHGTMGVYTNVEITGTVEVPVLVP